MRCIPITPTINFQVHLLHKSLSSQGKAEKDKLSRFPMAILVTSLTTPTSACYLSCHCHLPWESLTMAMGHSTTLLTLKWFFFFSFSTTAAQGWTELQEYRAMGHRSSKNIQERATIPVQEGPQPLEGAPRGTQQLPDQGSCLCWQPHLGTPLQFIAACGNSPHPRTAPGPCVGSRNKATRTPGRI